MADRWDADSGIDYMPEARRPPPRPRGGLVLASGNDTVAAGAALQPKGLLQYTGESEGPLVLQLGSPASPNTISEAGVATAFMPSTVLVEGVCYTRTATATQYPQLVQCILEYGLGAATRQVAFDWRPGAYQLPPCSSLKVSVLTQVVGGYAASVARGALGPQLDVPSFTFMGDGFAGGDGGPEYPVPVGAHAVEVLGGTGLLYFSNGQTYQLTTDYAYRPPVAPYRLSLGKPSGSNLFWRYGQDVSTDKTIIRFFLGL